MLAITQQPNTTIITANSHQSQINPLLWLNYFSPQSALDETRAHIEALPGSRHERHTMRAYLSSLADFFEFHHADVTRIADETYLINFNSMHMPTRATMSAYIAHSKQRGLSSATVTRYLASVRLFIRNLEEQQVIPQTGADFMFIMECQRQFKLAQSTKNPPADKTSNRPALEQHGQRLQLAQVNTLFDSFASEIDTLTGKRDLALLYLGITSGLRAAEIARITLDSITQGDSCFEIRVRGKRSNYDPVGIDSTAYALIKNFVDSWNIRATDALGGEGILITPSTPVFQPLLRGDNLPKLGVKKYDPVNGISERAVLMIVERRTQSALGKSITAHDMRRTCAYLMRSNGYEWDSIRAQLRHRSIGTTEKYVGKAQNLSRGLLSNSVSFSIPK